MAREITNGEWGRIIAHAWTDPGFAHALTTDPAKAAKSFLGLDASMEVHVYELPPKPADLTAQQLEDIRSGKSFALLPARPFSC
jgi:hypothetical protein